MRIKHLAPALLAALTPLSASAGEAEIYGLFHISADYLNADAGDPVNPNSGDEGATISSNSSRLGFRGNTPISDALTAIWQVEVEVYADNGSALATDRNTFAGLRGDWGQLRAGRFDTPFKLLHSRTSLFSDQVGDGRNILRADIADGLTTTTDANWWNERLRNSIAYQTPSWNNLTANLQYSSNQDAAAATSSDQASWSASLEWRGENIWLAVAHEKSARAVAAVLTERQASRAALSWQLGDTRLVGLYQRADNPDIDAWGAGIKQNITDKLAVKTHYYRLNAAGVDQDAELFAVGMEYTVAKELVFYGTYGQVTNGDLINRDPWSQGRNDDLVSGNGDTPDAVSAGMIYRF
ncbi:porin [Alcanivorax sp. 1008]|uniref:porin n=1 Tax=Alcanivorax sp. 1008 TaxID=2816853 RepID=UPI001D91739B|nr:porin [Alcanivorax sp. 1008]MCC1496452.1 porin [Alcanivorax sp. 1008]